MYENMRSIFVGMGQKVVIGLMLGTTIFLTGTAVIKVANIERKAQVESRTQDTPTLSDPVQQKTEEEPTVVNVVDTPTPTKAALPTPTRTSTPAPTRTPTVTLSNTNLQTKCIVTIFGKLYDVTSLRNTHSGGDIFACGTDMSKTYQNQHGTNMSRMARYEVSANGTSTNTTGTSPNLGNSREVEDDDK